MQMVADEKLVINNCCGIFDYSMCLLHLLVTHWCIRVRENAEAIYLPGRSYLSARSYLFDGHQGGRICAVSF